MNAYNVSQRKLHAKGEVIFEKGWGATKESTKNTFIDSYNLDHG